MGSSGNKPRRTRRRLPKVERGPHFGVTRSSVAPGPTQASADVYRALNSPYPAQRRRAHIWFGGIAAFCGAIVLLAVIFGR